MTERKEDGLDAVWQALVEKDDRTSPEEYPDMVLITRDELRATLSASSPPVGGSGEVVVKPLEWVPEGFKLVPIEPTPDMLRAGMDDLGWWVEPYDAPRESGVPVETDISSEDAAKINAQQIEVIAATYRAMLAASPVTPEGLVGGEK